MEKDVKSSAFENDRVAPALVSNESYYRAAMIYLKQLSRPEYKTEAKALMDASAKDMGLFGEISRLNFFQPSQNIINIPTTPPPMPNIGTAKAAETTPPLPKQHDGHTTPAPTQEKYASFPTFPALRNFITQHPLPNYKITYAIPEDLNHLSPDSSGNITPLENISGADIKESFAKIEAQTHGRFRFEATKRAEKADISFHGFNPRSTSDGLGYQMVLSSQIAINNKILSKKKQKTRAPTPPTEDEIIQHILLHEELHALGLQHPFATEKNNAAKRSNNYLSDAHSHADKSPVKPIHSLNISDASYCETKLTYHTTDARSKQALQCFKNGKLGSADLIALDELYPSPDQITAAPTPRAPAPPSAPLKR